MIKYLYALLFIIIIFLSGCGITQETPSKFNPPDWILGVWNGSGDTIVYEFTSDNIISSSNISSKIYSINFKEAYSNIEVNENISSSLYSVEVTINAIKSLYKFEKNDTKIDYYITTNGVTIGPLVLSKQ